MKKMLHRFLRQKIRPLLPSKLAPLVNLEGIILKVALPGIGKGDFVMRIF